MALGATRPLDFFHEWLRTRGRSWRRRRRGFSMTSGPSTWDPSEQSVYWDPPWPWHILASRCRAHPWGDDRLSLDSRVTLPPRTLGFFRYVIIILRLWCLHEQRCTSRVLLLAHVFFTQERSVGSLTWWLERLFHPAGFLPVLFQLQVNNGNCFPWSTHRRSVSHLPRPPSSPSDKPSRITD